MIDKPIYVTSPTAFFGRFYFLIKRNMGKQNADK